MSAYPFLSDLQAAHEFLTLHSRFSEVQGFLIPLEGYALHLMAAEGPKEGAIVEVGSFMGLSTCWLASGSQRASREKVTAVDHFRGSPEHQPGAEIPIPELEGSGTTFERFKENIEGQGLGAYVEPIQASSEEACQGWSGSIRLLFIDGDHSYEESRKDFELWSPFVVEGGLIAFHDIGNAPGVTKFYKELLQRGGYIELFGAVSLSVVVRQ
jgi:predicted O-methyltransferase YrrM